MGREAAKAGERLWVKAGVEAVAATFLVAAVWLEVGEMAEVATTAAVVAAVAR